MWYASFLPLVVAMAAIVLGGEDPATIGTPHTDARTGSAVVPLQDATGCYIGTVGPTGGQARVILDPEGSGTEVGGSVHVLLQYIETVEIESGEIDGSNLTIDFTSPDGNATSIRGTLDGDGLTGTVETNDGSQPVTMTRIEPGADAPARELVGYWEGGLVQGSSILLRLGLRIEEAPCGQVIVTLDSPDQAAEDIPTSAVSLDGDAFQFEVGAVGGGFEGTISEDGRSMRGTWSQGGQSLTMTMEL